MRPVIQSTYMLDSAFQLLFSERPAIFQQGEFRFLPTTGSYVAALLVVVAIGVTFLTYRAARSKSDARHRLVLAVIRTATLLLLLPLHPRGGHTMPTR